MFHGKSKNGFFFHGTFNDDVNEIIRLVNGLSERYKRCNGQIISLNKQLSEENKMLKDNICPQCTRPEKYPVQHGFEINNEEYEAIEQWKCDHEKEKHNGKLKHGAIGGNYTYEFIPTSIGTIGSIRCSCGEYFIFKEI